MEKKDSKIKAMIFGFIGSIIGSLPWVLIYLFTGKIYYILLIAIVLFGYVGYYLFYEKIGIIDLIIMGFEGIISSAIATFVLLPAFFLLKEGYQLSIDSIKALYTYESFYKTLLEAFGLSALFVVIAIIFYIKELKKDK